MTIANRKTQLSDTSEEARGVLQGSGNKKRRSAKVNPRQTATQHRLAISGSLLLHPLQKKKNSFQMAANFQRWTGNKCVSFGTRPHVCVVCADALESCSAWFSAQSATSCRSLIYQCILMFSVLAGRPTRPPAARPLPPRSVSADGSCCSVVRSQLCEASDMLHSGKGLRPNACTCLCACVCVWVSGRGCTLKKKAFIRLSK